MSGGIGPYRILEPLGAGAHGDVYLAEDTRLGRRVALKTLRDLGSHGMAETRHRLLREARAAARLNHPHIAAIYDVVETPEALHIVMEHVPGATLSARLRQGPLQPHQVLDIGIQLASALAHAHGHGVIHRDLKPGNIVLTSEGQAKILDFGVARTVALPSDPGSLSTASTDVRVLVGTPPYMPPEHIMGAPVDARGDLYSLGVTLFEALTARRPFEAGDLPSLARAILTDPTPHAGDSAALVPAELDAVVFRAMARDPLARYEDASALESDLKRVSAHVTDAPTASRVHRRAFPRIRQRSTLASVAALVAVVLALGAYVMGASGRPPSFGGSGGPPPSGPHVVAVLPLLGATADAQTEALAAGVGDSLITALSKLDGVTVVSRSAMIKHRDRKQDVEDIAREMGASLLVDGSLQRSGEALRLTLSLLQPGSKVVQWQESYDGDFKDVLRVQREVASAVVQSLRVKLSPETRARLEQKPTDNVEALADYSQARAFMERPDVKGNTDRAIDLFQRAIGKDPRFAWAHAGLGQAYWAQYSATKREDFSQRARDSITEALRLDPEDGSVRFALASLYRGMGRLPEAIEEYRRAGAINPNADDPHRMLGQLLVQTGQVTEGLAELQRAIDIRPSYWVNHHALGAAYYGVGRYSEALAPFRRVIELQPDSAWGYQLLGTAYHALDDAEHAIPNYETAIRLGDAKAYSNLGSLYYTEGHLEQAARSLLEALKLEPNSRKHHALGDVYVRMGRSKEARREFASAIETAHAELRVNPRDASVLARLALAEAKLNQFPLAERHMRDAISIEPDNPDIRFSEAILRVLTGKPNDAFDALAQALKHGFSARRAAKDPYIQRLRAKGGFATLISPSLLSSSGGH